MGILCDLFAPSDCDNGNNSRLLVFIINHSRHTKINLLLENCQMSLLNTVQGTPEGILGDKLRYNTTITRQRRKIMLIKYVPVLHTYLTNELTKFSTEHTISMYTFDLDHVHSLLRREAYFSTFIEDVPKTLTVEDRTGIFALLKERFTPEGLILTQQSHYNELCNIIIVEW